MKTFYNKQKEPVAVSSASLLEIVIKHQEYEWHKEMLHKEGDDNYIAYFVIKRKGNEPYGEETPFTVEDSKKLGLWGKPGPWSDFPERMMMVMARRLTINHAFPDLFESVELESISEQLKENLQ